MHNGSYKLGRTARSHDPRIPHFSALAAGKALPAIPPSQDWSTDMPSELGMMMNDTLGDCTCAAVYHARQVWTANTGNIVTEPDSDVEMLYEKACGYNPNQPGEGPGGNEQHVLKYLLKRGAPIGDGGASVDKISAFVEIDPRNQDDVKRAIYACGVAYIGFNVPASLMPPNEPPPQVWTVDPQNSQSIGGHAVVLCGYDDQSAKVISWGQYYQMTWPFFAKFVDEAYAIADDAWFNSRALDPLGVSLADLESQMQALQQS